MNIDQLIGLELSCALALVNGEKFKLAYYTDEKQKNFDKEIVIRALLKGDVIELTIGRFLFVPQE